MGFFFPGWSGRFLSVLLCVDCGVLGDINSHLMRVRSLDTVYANGGCIATAVVVWVSARKKECEALEKLS